MAYENGDFVPAGAVSAGDVLIDGNAIGDVGNVVLRDRKVLSEDGIFIVAITLTVVRENCGQGSCSHAWICLSQEESRYSP